MADGWAWLLKVPAELMGSADPAGSDVAGRDLGVAGTYSTGGKWEGVEMNA